MTTKVLALSYIERKLFWVLSGLVVMLSGYYFCTMLSITSTVVSRDHIARAIHEASLEVGELEGEYMALQNGITLERANGLGLREVAAVFAGTKSGAVNTNNSVKVSFAR